ncbi:MAG: D-alanyl-D-alanine carboxypeptidase family protein [Thermoleophilaceae bacterium]
MRGRHWLRGTIGAGLSMALLASSAQAAVPHVVQPGQTLWSISAANNLTTRTVAVYNGLPEDAHPAAGQTIQVPTEAEGATALAEAGLLGTPLASGTDRATTVAPSAEPPPPPPAAWLAPVLTLEGTAYLDAGAASAWEAMREEALASHGVDLQPAGTMSAYRSWEQQAYLYDLFISGQGAPANSPGTSSHELGVAVDVPSEDMAVVIQEIGSAYGWVAPIPGEWWHFEFVNY